MLSNDMIQFGITDLKDKYIISTHQLTFKNKSWSIFGITEILTITSKENLVISVIGTFDAGNNTLELKVRIKNKNLIDTTSIDLNFEDRDCFFYDKDDIKFILMRPSSYNIDFDTSNYNNNPIFYLDNKFDEMKFLTMVACL